mgnify:CR=1 FL=1
MRNGYSNENYAGFWVRLAAYVIDSVIVAIGLLVVRLAWIGIGALISGTILDENVLFHYSLKDIVLYIFKVMYFALLTWCTGTTIGKRLMNLRVVPADRNEKLSFVDVLYRETVGRFLCGISIWIGYIIVGIDKEKRAFTICSVTQELSMRKSEHVSRVSECGRTADVCTAARTSADTELCTEKCASAESVTARTTV